MNRQSRRLAGGVSGIAAAAGLALVAGLVMPLLSMAQDASPEPADAVVPLVWELTAFEDSALGITPVDDSTQYTIQFRPDGRAAIRADCNSGSGEYTMEGNSLEFGPIATTLALCPPESLSDRYLQELTFVRSFEIDRSGATDQLVMGLMADGGFLRFSPAITGVVWEWTQFQGGDGAIVAPDDPSQYTLEFLPDGAMRAQVDCNRGMGQYEIDDRVSFSIVLGTTRMACPEGSLDGEFIRYVSEASSYVIWDGQFSLSLPYDSGIATFAPRFVEDGQQATPEAG